MEQVNDASKMELNAIFAVTKVEKSPTAFAFGADNDLIIRNSIDMKNFKDMTTGHVLIMGRNTFESLGSKPLPNRKSIVVSKSVAVDDWEKQEDVILVRNLNDAIKTANELGAEKVFIIGGANLIREGMLLCKNIYYTVYDYYHPFNDDDVFMNMNLLLGTKMFTMCAKKEYKEECTIVATGEKRMLKFRMLTAMNSTNFQNELKEKAKAKKLLKEDRKVRKMHRKLGAKNLQEVVENV